LAASRFQRFINGGIKASALKADASAVIFDTGPRTSVLGWKSRIELDGQIKAARTDYAARTIS
jgi:hypothetical protein